MKRKTILIVGLLVVVLIMAVGYAAFGTELNVNTTSAITSSWKVGFDKTKTAASYGVVTTHNGYTNQDNPTTGSSNPSGTIVYPTDTSATVTSQLYQPGDSVTFVLTIKNTGTLTVNLGQLSITSSTCTVDPNDSTVYYSESGHQKFTVTGPSTSSLSANGTATVTIVAEYPNITVSKSLPESASLTITFYASQA